MKSQSVATTTINSSSRSLSAIVGFIENPTDQDQGPSDRSGCHTNGAIHQNQSPVHIGRDICKIARRQRIMKLRDLCASRYQSPSQRSM
ncbi:hypothetical protein MRB53_017360 [Persea americana]|uniref:Uncharacterized protein n=1 Tax=Persea americana TaxID=3435 RepID=A0ACC2M4U9_PERAE|nr:hypothetical protein MRB53_017360 [Persea americana]